MKRILAVVKPFLAQEVLESISEFPIDTVTVREAKGYRRYRNDAESAEASEYARVYLPKLELNITVEEQHVEPILQRISSVARTGRPGDGKLFVFDVPVSIEF